MEFKEGNIPLYFQFYLKIKNDIMLGEIEPGSRLPNIELLHKQYRVSHATVRRALTLLEKEGLIIKKRGLGIIVRDQVDLLAWNPPSMLDITDGALKNSEYKVLCDGWIEPPRRIEKRFGDQPDVFRNGLIFKVRRLWVYKEDRRKKRLSDAYYPASIAALMGEEKLRHSTLAQEGAESPRFRSIKIHQTLRPWICDMATAELLGIPDGTPVFHRTWVVLSPTDEVQVISEVITTANSLVRTMVTEVPVKSETQQVF